LALARPLLWQLGMQPEPVSPIRDATRLGPTEDLDREPDGVPHDVVGLTALFTVVLAALALTMLSTGTVGIVAVVVIAALAAPALLGRRSARERDPRHASR
jgi:Flp pilus assembly protein TadB